MWIGAGETSTSVRRVARQELVLCFRHKSWRRLAMEDLNVELKRYKTTSRPQARPAQVWVAKGRVASIYLMMAAIEPRVFILAAARHAVRRVRFRRP